MGTGGVAVILVGVVLQHGLAIRTHQFPRRGAAAREDIQDGEPANGGVRHDMYVKRCGKNMTQNHV